MKGVRKSVSRGELHSNDRQHGYTKCKLNVNVIYSVVALNSGYRYLYEEHGLINSHN